MKKFFAILLVVCAVFTLLGCIPNTTEAQQEEVLTTIVYKQSSQTTPAESQYTEQTYITPEATQPAAITDVISDTAPLNEPDTIPTAINTEDTTIGKTGDMAFSDDPSNRYINAVATKYSLNSANLVALYTVPENDANIVLEFDGTKDANGKLIRTDATLIAIYSIDKSLNSKCASKDTAKNEYPYGEMMVMFITTTKHIMPEFEGQF